jgi:signal transduction histidine kinase
MSWTDVRTRLGRVEWRIAAPLVVVSTLLVVLVLLVAYGHAARELMEESERAVERQLEAMVALADGRTQALEGLDQAFASGLRQDLAFRLFDAQGREVGAWGVWPADEVGRFDEQPPYGPFQVSGDAFLAVAAPLADGGVLEAAVPLRHFARERAELVRRGLTSLAVGLLAAVLAAWFLVPRMVSPLAEATRAVEGIDENRLETRLRTRGTGDAVDRHAEAVNRLLSRLQWAFERMRGFSADVAHELRTPIHRILNVADVAALEDADPERARAALQGVRSTAEQMRRLVESLLLLARGEEGRLPLRPKRLELSSLLRDLLDLYAPLCEENDLHLELRTEPVEVLGERELLGRCLANLVENAIRLTPPGGKLLVELARVGRDATVAVSDTGPGVPLAERANIFERFVQLEPARARRGGGLGLPIARMIARLHGGDVTLGSPRLGGATFLLHLPCLPPA